MAQIIDKKFPLDQQKRKIVGFGFPLNGNAVFKPTYTTTDQIKANLINYLLTNKGERVFNNFGANLREFIHEASIDNTLEGLEERIQTSISRYFPSVLINNVTFNRQNNTDSITNVITLSLNYTIQDFGVTDNINIQIV